MSDVPHAANSDVETPSGTYAAKTHSSDAATPARPEPDFVFTHGKGTSLDNEALVAFAQGFARTHTILCFEDLRDMTSRLRTFRSLMNHFSSISAAGGRSMGARASCRAVLYSPVKQLIFLTYPLARGLSERYKELLASETTTDILFLVGDSGPMCIELLLKPIRQRMRLKSWWIKNSR
jgi:predicted alpha/beta-hydrolase family hydrolase